MLAGGGESCADIEHLRVEDRLFGQSLRLRPCIGPCGRSRPRSARSSPRRSRRCASGCGHGRRDHGHGPVVLDIDASLVQIHSENKAGTGPTYKGGFGFHPMFCFADATGEALASCCAPATPERTTSPTTSPCSTPRSPSSRASRGRAPGRRRRRARQEAGDRAGRFGRLHRRVRGGMPRTQHRLLVVARRTPQIHAAIFATTVDRRLAARNAPRRRSARRHGGRVTAVLTDRVARRDPADRAPRTPPPRRPHALFPSMDLPLLGVLHRPRRRPRQFLMYARPRPR